MSRRAERRAALRAAWVAAQVTGRISATLAEPFVSALWFTPWRVPVGDRERARRAEWLRDTERISLTADGVRLEGFAAGRGATVLLVHGWGEEAAALGAFVAPLVAAGMRVVAFDLPGHGRSGDADTDLYSLGQAVRTAAESVGAEAAIGHSMGGAVTGMALRDGLRLRTVVLIAPAVRLEHALAQFAAMFRLPARAAAALRRRIERRFGRGVWADTRVDAAAGAFDVPGLIVHDRNDAQIAVADAEMLARAWPGSRLVVTDGLGHARILRDREVLDSVGSFLAEHLAVAGNVAPLQKR